MPKIIVENIDVIFGKNKKQAAKFKQKGLSKNDILKKTGCTIGVNNANLKITKGEVFVIMGLSGSGKSTLLRCFNRLIEPTSGKIYIDKEDIIQADQNHLRQLRRHKMSMVFQHFGLLPHRTVISNVGFGLEIQGVNENDRYEKAEQTIKTVGLDGYEYMMTGELSGGMQQRVGLARALATDPEILLMDEAFSALDPLIRNNMQDELLSLQEKLHKTIVFITHDLDEALKLGDRIAIMKDGKIVQVGTPEEIIVDPANKYVSSFVEQVDRSTVVTASSIMIDHVEKIRLNKDGPNTGLHKMRKLGVSVLPVIGENEHFKGFIDDESLKKMVKTGNKNFLQHIISQEDVNAVYPDTPVGELLPFFIHTNLPVAVINKEKKLLGIVIHSSVIAEVVGKETEEIEEISKEGGVKYD